MGIHVEPHIDNYWNTNEETSCHDTSAQRRKEVGNSINYGYGCEYTKTKKKKKERKERARVRDINIRERNTGIITTRDPCMTNPCEDRNRSSQPRILSYFSITFYCTFSELVSGLCLASLGALLL